MKKISFLTLLMGLQLVLFSQTKPSIGIETGFFNASKWFHDYYFSSNVSIPLTKVFSISPSFTYGETLPNGFYYLQFNKSDNYEGITYEPNDLKSSYRDNRFFSLDLIVLIDFLKIIDKNNDKHELLIGGGVGYKSYTISEIRYRHIESEIPYSLSHLKLKRDTRIAPYYFKITYNRQVKNNIYLGVTTSLNDIYESLFFYGINLNVKF